MFFYDYITYDYKYKEDKRRNEKLVVPLPLLDLEKYDNTANEQNEEIKYLVEILANILPEYIGV